MTVIALLLHIFLIRTNNERSAAGGNALIIAKKARCIPETAFGSAHLCLPKIPSDKKFLIR